MSGGSYDYLGNKARSRDLIPIPDDLEEMAERLSGLPYATQAAADTAAVIADLRAVAERAARLCDVWHAVEWWDSNDWDEDQVREAVAAYDWEPDGDVRSNADA